MLDWSTLPLKELLPWLGGAALAAAGFLLKRCFEDAGGRERREKLASLAALKREMDDADLSIDDLLALDEDIRKRRQNHRNIEDEVQDAISSHRVVSARDTQGGMNSLAAADLEVARSMLKKAVVELELVCEGTDRERFEEAQQAWEQYAEAEARHRASSFEGGTIYPTIYLPELERLTVSRIADIKEHMNWLENR
ncbi:MAG: DUF1311 domain-containing protein [Alphaproteobacteria bacterium]|nr:DUF1311 domain-containing protein [Alphaproteobacteria bacterium]